MTRRRTEVARREAEIEDLGPYLALAREIQGATRTAAAGADATAQSLVDAIEAIPNQERRELLRATFNRLAPDQQWAILALVFGDEEIRGALETERRAHLESARRSAGHAGLIARARAEKRVDGREIRDALLTLGLFREDDVHAALDRGPLSTTCARRLVLRADEAPGPFSVVEDVFNPAGGYFVTAFYDQDTWRDHDRLPAHASVRVGSIVSANGRRSFEPIIHLASRLDFERDGELIEGRLHLGFMLVDDLDVFSSGGSTP